MTWTLVSASKITRKASLVVGLSGLSGAGKTYSALLLAKIIARGGKVVGICTENNRMADYQDTGLYPDLNPYEMFKDGFEAPFSSERYIEAIMAAEASGASVIVLDSGSDEWEGPGGVLDLHEQTLQRLIRGDESKREKMNFPAWAVAKPPHKRFANELMRLKAHLIICFRAQPKTAMPVVNGKRTVVDLGLQPICGSALPYKLRWHVLLDVDRPGYYTVLKAYEHERDVFPPDQKIDAGTGARMLAMIVPADHGPAISENQGPAISADQALDIEALIHEVGADREKFLTFIKSASVAEIAKTDYKKAIDALERKR